jgi:hypothetical protein
MRVIMIFRSAVPHAEVAVTPNKSLYGIVTVALRILPVKVQSAVGRCETEKPVIGPPVKNSVRSMLITVPEGTGRKNEPKEMKSGGEVDVGSGLVLGQGPAIVAAGGVHSEGLIIIIGVRKL